MSWNFSSSVSLEQNTVDEVVGGIFCGFLFLMDCLANAVHRVVCKLDERFRFHQLQFKEDGHAERPRGPRHPMEKIRLEIL